MHTATGSRRTLRRAAVSAALVAAGCANFLGIDEPVARPACTVADDCDVGFECVSSRCACVDGCGEGGEGNLGGTNGRSGPVGGLGGLPSGGASGAAATNGGDSAGVAGEAGGTDSAGGTGGVPASGGNGDPGGAGGEGGSSQDEPECDPHGESSCLLCDDTGHFVPGTRCDAACQGEGICVTPPSCDALDPMCADENCCLSLPVSGGSFLRACDNSCQASCPGVAEGFPAHLSSFSLDAFEVTVARFRRFVRGYPVSRPGAGTGRNLRNEHDAGWNSAWDTYLPDSEQAFRDALSSSERCAGRQTWTDSAGANDALPMNCVTWYEALAFCIWDGGRLPTQAERNYAAAGGAEQRTFPWSSASIDSSYAVFASAEDPPTGPAPVGSCPKGRGKWLQYDLAGNLAEWVWDRQATCYPTPAECDDCGWTDGSDEKVVSGAAFFHDADSLHVDVWLAYTDTSTPRSVGFRCARDL